MRIRKTGWGLCILLLIILLTAFGCGQRKNSGKFEAYLEDSEESYTIDNYCCSLEKQFYDSNSGLGYLVFSAKARDKVIEAEIDENNQLEKNCFGDQARFSIQSNASQDCLCYIEEDTLWIYIQLVADLSAPLEVYLEDYSQKDMGTIDGYKHYDFEINQTEQVKTYSVNDGGMLFLTPMGVSLNYSGDDSEYDGRIYLKFVLNDSEYIIDTEEEIGTAGMSEEFSKDSTDSETRVTFLFNNAMDISKIDHIEYVLKGNSGIIQE